jgi:hypothetical protein
MRSALLAATAALLCHCQPTPGQVYNLKLVTDARPDYSDMDSMVRSMTARWAKPMKKCWAQYYWNHFGRRQTTPMTLHGYEHGRLRLRRTIMALPCRCW